MDTKQVLILNIKNETVKCSEEKIGEKLCDLELKKEILDMTPKAWATEGKIDNLDVIKLKTFVLKEGYQESTTTTLTIRESICKSCI